MGVAFELLVWSVTFFQFLASASSSNLKTINAFLIFSGAVGVSEFDSNNGFRTVTRDPKTSRFMENDGPRIPDYQWRDVVFLPFIHEICSKATEHFFSFLEMIFFTSHVRKLGWLKNFESKFSLEKSWPWKSLRTPKQEMCRSVIEEIFNR